jgi:tRNA (mo5U34)-methyltransferase
MTQMRSREETLQFLADSRHIWHQRFQLVPGVYTPGVNDMDRLFEVSKIPPDLSGQTVLDIGTANGGAAFEAERRGAARVVAVDIYPAERFGVDAIRDFLGSHIEFVQANLYELPALLAGERFDLVLLWGVLYHLRHPLLALDAVRMLTRQPDGQAFVESAVCDFELGSQEKRSYVRFYRRHELGGDGSNWFAPSVAALVDWCQSSGFEAAVLDVVPAHAPTRCTVRITPTPDPPEYVTLSYERPLHVTPA